MTEGEQKRENYTIKRRTNAIRLSINTAIHSLTNIGIFSGKEFWQTDPHLWNLIFNDTHRILADLVILKAMIESIIGAEKKDEKEE